MLQTKITLNGTLLKRHARTWIAAIQKQNANSCRQELDSWVKPGYDDSKNGDPALENAGIIIHMNISHRVNERFHAAENCR